MWDSIPGGAEETCCEDNGRRLIVARQGGILYSLWGRQGLGGGVESFLVAGILLVILGGESRADSPVERAISWLAREVPAWRPGNGCFSCHHDGDGATALLQARAWGYEVRARALDRTVEWLEGPREWDHNGGEGPFNDKRLARLQFTRALARAFQTGTSRNHQALVEAAEALAADQAATGSWPIEGDRRLGSPVTYGTILATATAVRILQAADAQRHEQAIKQARDYLDELVANNVFEAAALLSEDPAARPEIQLTHCLDLIREGQSQEGGWGPYATSQPEAFDSALAVLALCRVIEAKRIEGVVAEDLVDRVRRGALYLEAIQLTDGSWAETTRPAGATSNAQHMSTTAWATLALLHAGRALERTPDATARPETESPLPR